MSKQTMTPGPWVADEYGVITGNGLTSVAVTHQVKWGLCAEQSGGPAKSRCLELQEQANANAQAIAALPDLVAALQACEDYGDGSIGANPFDAARAALRKAGVA